MTATETRPHSQLTQLAAGVRSAVDTHADWSETAELVAERQPRRRCRRLRAPRRHPPLHNTADTTAISIHIYGTDVTRIGSSVRRFYD